MAQERALRFNELIKKELGKIISNFLDVEPGVLVTVTRVSTNPNLFTADVFVSVYPPSGAEKILEKLNRSIYQIQQSLNKKMEVRPVPKISFKYDANPEAAGEVEKLLEEIKKENRE
ncbi:30S ribosome-binding factor RbfA [Candidatus Azambacteria bacterium]|nr:30S ribosome-binding factor RbfA [Candidatus Azambacteria bacterium]